MKAGALVRWLKNGDRTAVSFNIGSSTRVPDLGVGDHSNVVVDYNVDGVIWDRSDHEYLPWLIKRGCLEGYRDLASVSDD